MSILDYRPWDWEVYTPKEEDEELDFYKELCPKIVTDISYWCKYELDFTPWEYSPERREEILEYMDEKKVDPNIFYPEHGYGQLDAMEAMSNDDYREVPVVAGRRSGKTWSYFGASSFILWSNFSLSNPPRSPMGIIIGSHRREHAVDVIMAEIRSRMRYTKNIKHYVTNDSKMSIAFGNTDQPNINSSIYSIPMSRYEQTKGYTNPLRVMIDEAVLIKDNTVFTSIRPLINQLGRVTLHDGSIYDYRIGIIYTSTPEGHNNYFANRFFIASQGDNPEMKPIRWHSLDSPYTNYKAIIDELTEPNCDELMWRQEYGAEFLYTANSFLEPELVDNNVDFDKFPFGNLNPTTRPLYWGIDWGAVRDSTVIYVQEDYGNRLEFKYAKEISNTEYDKQIDMIVDLARMLRPTMVKADVGGRAQNTILANKYGLPLVPVEGHPMALESKHHLYMHSKFMLQYHKQHYPNTLLPPNPKMREQMIGISVHPSMSGYLRFSDKHVGFDDWVDAFVLSCGCKQITGGLYSPQIVTRQAPKAEKRDWSTYRPVTRVTGTPKKGKTWQDRKRRLREEAERARRKR